MSIQMIENDRKCDWKYSKKNKNVLKKQKTYVNIHLTKEKIIKQSKTINYLSCNWGIGKGGTKNE